MQALALFLLLASSTLAVAQEPRLELEPGARPPASDWTQEVHTLRSNVLGERLRIYVGKPPTFGRAARAYPALYVLDGQYYFAEVLDVVAALAGAGHVPEMLVIGIESKDRRVDFTPSEIHLPDVGARARAGRYLDFLEHELVPAAEATLHAGKPRVLLGHSHAGMLAVHALARRPRVFPWVLALDAPVHHEQDFLAQDLRRALAEPERPAVRLVSAQLVFGWTAERWAELVAAGRPGDLLVRSEPEGETHESMVFLATYRGLQALFADSAAGGARELSALEIDERYRALAPLYGAEVVPPEPLMRRVIEDFLMEGYGKRANDWLARYVVCYGEPGDRADLVRQIEEATAQGEPTETVAGMLAFPRATPAEMASHLGEWKGATWMNDGPRSPTRIRFWVEAGAVRGEIAREQGPLMEVQYLRLRPDGGLEFGFRNGMRPRALIVYEEGRPGGALEGVMNFRGIRFTPPDGHVPPVMRFELERMDADAQKD